MLVQENNTDRQDNAEFLEKRGYAVAVADSVGEALSTIAERAPAIIFQDLIFPDMTAFGVIRKLQESSLSPEIPVVILADRSLSPEQRKKLAEDIERISNAGSPDGDSLPADINRVLKLEPFNGKENHSGD